MKKQRCHHLAWWQASTDPMKHVILGSRILGCHITPPREMCSRERGQGYESRTANQEGICLHHFQRIFWASFLFQLTWPLLYFLAANTLSQVVWFSFVFIFQFTFTSKTAQAASISLIHLPEQLIYRTTGQAMKDQGIRHFCSYLRMLFNFSPTGAGAESYRSLRRKTAFQCGQN